MRLNDANYTVVGVAPRKFTGSDGAAMALWVRGVALLLAAAAMAASYLPARRAARLNPTQALRE